MPESFVKVIVMLVVALFGKLLPGVPIYACGAVLAAFCTLIVIVVLVDPTASVATLPLATLKLKVNVSVLFSSMLSPNTVTVCVTLVSVVAAVV